MNELIANTQLTTTPKQYADDMLKKVVSLSAETGWRVSYIMSMPPWTFNTYYKTLVEIHEGIKNENEFLGSLKGGSKTLG